MAAPATVGKISATVMFLSPASQYPFVPKADINSSRLKSAMDGEKIVSSEVAKIAAKSKYEDETRTAYWRMSDLGTALATSSLVRDRNRFKTGDVFDRL